jgi:hypothetical protein
MKKKQHYCQLFPRTYFWDRAVEVGAAELEPPCPQPKETHQKCQNQHNYSAGRLVRQNFDQSVELGEALSQY